MAWTSRKPKKAPEPLAEAALYDHALGALGRRMLTVAQLSRRLRTRVEPGEQGDAKIRSVLARLREYGMVDDARYAEEFSRLRQGNQKLGERRVRQDLLQRGIRSEVAAAALERTYAETDETALALAHLRRKRVATPSDDKSTARVARLLARAGFSANAIWPALRALKAQEDVVADLSSNEAYGDAEPF